MVSSFSNLDLPGPDEGYPSSQQFSGTNYGSYNGGELFSGNNSGDNSDSESKAKNEHFLNSAVVLQQKKAFESFVISVYKDSKEMNRYFESVKSSLGSKLEQVFSSDTMLEYFDRISQKPFSRIANTNKSRWTDDEVLLLTHIVIYYSYANATEFETLPDDAWTYIATIFPNKEVSQLKKRWQGCLKKTLWQIPWTQQEDELLEKIINEKGHTRKWKEIAEELNACSELEVYRHGRQCRERWNNHLDPNIARGPFTEEEDMRLFQIYKETGKKWAEISKKMKTRTENAVKNRFNSLMKKLKSRQNTTLSENQSMMSIESEPDNSKHEKRLVDQFLQQFEIGGGGIGSKSHLDKTRTSLLSKSEIPDHDQSESIFESDSESYSQNPKSLNYLDAALPKKNGNDKDRTRSMGELNDDFRAFPSSNFQMEEEFPATRGHSNSVKRSKFENSFSGHVEKFEMLSNQNYTSQQHSSNHPFSQNNLLNKTNSMFPESPTRGRSNSVPYQSKSPHAQNLFTNSLFGTNSNLDNLNLSVNPHQKNPAKFQPSTMGYKPMGNPLLTNPNADQGGPDSAMNSLNQFLECEGSNGNSPLRQNRFPFENYDTKGPAFSQTKLEEEDMNEISPTKRIGEFNHQLKARKLDKYQAQRQIGRANLQYAIVDLTKNEIYLVHPVTKENFSGTISKMNGEDSLLASPFGTPHNNFLSSEFLMLGKSGGEHSPSIGYLQSIMGKPNPVTEPNPNAGLPSLFNTSADYSDKNKPSSMTLVEQHFQNIRKKFGVLDSSEYAFKGKGNNNTQP